MDEPEACGSEEKNVENEKFLGEYENVSQFMQQSLWSVLQATKASNEMPAAGDDWDYYSSYQGFQEVMNIEGKRILHIAQSILKHQNVKMKLGEVSGPADIEDKLDLLMDANDQILEKVGTWLDEASGVKKDESALVVATATPKTPGSASWNRKSPATSTAKPASNFRLLSARNIQRPQIKFKDKVDNRPYPFRPIIKEKPHAKQSLDESLRLPEGITPEMAEAPDFLHPHPYKFEIDNVQYRDDQLTPSTPTQPASLEETPCLLIDTTDQVEDMLKQLKQHSLIAVDLEHHSYRTFQGITCLLQISTAGFDYLVDTLALRSDLQCLNEVFADPNILKVFHGADMDIDWLQRDLGIYVVNMFDTGQAARVLNFSRFSLAYLLQHYCDVAADKQYQLADWRIRPLPEELQRYAREDTHYLLYIYQKMKNELIDRGNNSNNLLLSVLNRSAQICLKVYKKPQCNSESHIELYKRNKKVFNSQQLLALKELFSWRDETGRMEDESCGYVLPNHMLLQICDILPRERQGVLACCNPIPPLVRQYINEIHNIIQRARDTPLTQVEHVQEKRPSVYQHPKYNNDSLLHCPHDLSNQDHSMETDTVTCLLDSSQKLTQPTKDSKIVVLKKAPLLSAFGSRPNGQQRKDVIGKKVADIKYSFSNPYYQFIPGENKESIITRGKLSSQPGEGKMWKLLRVSAKQGKTDSKEETPVAPPPSKRSRTDLGNVSQDGVAVAKHLRFTDDDDDNSTQEWKKTADDKKALPQDLQIPLRYQMPTKKQKKNRNRDIDIIESVQEHLANLRKIQEDSERALGENDGDDQPVRLPEAKKQTQSAKQWKKQKDSNNGKSDSKIAKTSENSDNANKAKSETSKTSDNPRTSTKVSVVIDNDSVNETSKGNKAGKESDIMETETIEIDDGSSDSVEFVKEEFTPYDYNEGAKKLLEGGGKSRGGGRDYYKPGGGRGKAKNVRNRGHQNKGQKSFSWKPKKQF